MTKSIRPRARFLKHSLILTLTAFSLGGVGLQAQEAIETPRPHLLSLQDCISLALQESPALEASRFDVATAIEEVRSARAKLLPDLTAEAPVQALSVSPTR